MAILNVSACLVTRGDVNMTPIIASLPFDNVVIWDNSVRGDLAVYGRYAAIEEARYDLIYVQDDDCIVSDPQAIVQAYLDSCPVVAVPEYDESCWWDGVVCNMPDHFRHDFYRDHALVGFGAVFHRDAPQRAFERWWKRYYNDNTLEPVSGKRGAFHRTADIVFTGLTPYILVDVPYEDLPWASAENRMWKQPTHVAERTAVRELVLKMRGS